MFPVCVCAIEQKDGVCYLRKTAETERLEVPRSLARFLSRLDGKTDPLALAPGFSIEQMDELLSMLEELHYIRSRRWNHSLFIAQITLWFAPRRIPAAVRRVCRAISMALMSVWLPVLIVGLLQFLRGNWVDGGNGTLGAVLGLLVGIAFHEAGHAVSCVGLGGRLVRAGVCSQLAVIPGAFVEVDYVRLPRAARVHILLSGVETNFLLAGLACSIGVVLWGDFFILFGAVNIMLGMLNLGIYFIALDGGKALEELLGVDLELSEKILTEHRVRRAIRKRAGATGSARIAASQILCVLQFGILSLLIINLKEVLSWIF